MVPKPTKAREKGRERNGALRSARVSVLEKCLTPPTLSEMGGTSLVSTITQNQVTIAEDSVELSTFEGRYLREVGVLYAELDEWKAKIAQLVAEEEGTVEARSAATEARTQAEKSYSAAHGEAARATEFTPSPELKKLYRDVAKRMRSQTDDIAKAA